MNEDGLCKFLGIKKERLEFLYLIGIPYKLADKGPVFNERDVLKWLERKAP